MSNSPSKYFDLHTTGIGYLNRVRQVKPQEGDPFWTISLAALRGSVDKAQYTHFECRVSGKDAQEIVRRLQAPVDRELKVLINFTLSDLNPEIFTYKQGDRAGTSGVSIKARLLRITWAKVDGQLFYSEESKRAA